MWPVHRTCSTTFLGLGFRGLGDSTLNLQLLMPSKSTLIWRSDPELLLLRGLLRVHISTYCSYRDSQKQQVS